MPDILITIATRKSITFKQKICIKTGVGHIFSMEFLLRLSQWLAIILIGLVKTGNFTKLDFDIKQISTLIHEMVNIHYIHSMRGNMIVMLRFFIKTLLI